MGETGEGNSVGETGEGNPMAKGGGRDRGTNEVRQGKRTEW